MRDVLAVISILGFTVVSVLCLLGWKFGNEWAAKMMDTILPMVIQCWIINFTQLMSYHYGTSASSQRKSETLKNIVESYAKPSIEGEVQLVDEIRK